MTALEGAPPVEESEPSLRVEASLRRLADGRLWAALLLGLSLALGALLRLWLATHDDGISWPDEIYQSLEPAHRLVFGYGVVAWEFQVGARNWALPGLVALLLKASVLAGLGDPRSYLTVVRVAFCVIGLATAWASFLLARSQGASAFGAAAAGALFALSAPAVFFAPRAMGESAAALAVALGLTLALGRDGRGWRLVLGVGLLALAACLRLQTAIFGVGLIVLLAAAGERRSSLLAFAAFAAGMVGLGLSDVLTWGSFFHSAIAYVQANVLQGRAATWGSSWAGYYLVTLITAMGPAGSLMLALGTFALRRSPRLWLLGVGFVAVHSAIPHKELRFLLPALPVLCALAGLGLDEVAQLSPGWLARSLGVALVASLALSAATFHDLTFGQLGSGDTPWGPNASAYDASGSVNRLLLLAGRRPDLCGLKVESARPEWTGGYSYLHRQVPMYRFDGPPRSSGKFDYVIARAGSPGSTAGKVVARDGDQVLLRLPITGCRPDPGHVLRLEG
jgi:uncharacterized membrane protein YuzA (DUF378 family)